MLIPAPLGGGSEGAAPGEEGGSQEEGGDTVCREWEEGQGFVKQACRPGHLHSAP